MATAIGGLVDRGARVARRFGVKEVPVNPAREGLEEVAGRVMEEIGPGRVVMIEGPSGSGKSSLLEIIRRRLGERALSVDAAPLPEAIVVDCLPQVELEMALEILARFGLGEVYTYLSSARKLSTGQQFRLRMAMAWAHMAAGGVGKVLLCDEFATQLDEVSAGVLGRMVRRQVTADGRVCAVVATCHGWMERAVRPEVVVRCDFGRVEVAA